MPELTLRNIEEISRDVGRQEITFPHLRDELTDHICCDVENEMQKGLSFADAYLAVRRKLGSRRLREIQEETLFAVDTKYRKMKTTMKISGIAGTVLLGFAALFKIMHWPGAGIMLMLGGFILAFVFMPSALTVLWKETHNTRRLFLYVTAFIAGMLFITGVVFKMQHWPGAGIILSLAVLSGLFFFLPALLAGKLIDQENRSKKIVYILGALGLFLYAAGMFFKFQHWPQATIFLSSGLAIIYFVAFPWYTRLTWKDDNHVSTGFIFMIVGSLAIVIPSLLISLNLQRNYEGGWFLLRGQQQALTDYQLAANRTSVNGNTDTLVSPVLASLSTETDKLLKIIEGIEAEMKAEAGEDLFSTTPFQSFLKEGTGTRTRLNKALEEYSDFLSDLKPESSGMITSELLDPAAWFPPDGPETERISLMTGLHMLDLLKGGILTAESFFISAVSQN